MSQPKTLLIDGDVILYTMAFAVQANQGDYLDLREAIHEEAERWGAIEPAGDIIMCLSIGSSDPEKRSFRYEAYPEYKKHRLGVDKPIWYDDAAAILRSDFYYAECPRLEGDDVLGILGTRLPEDTAVIVTIDKDLQQIPGWHWNPRKDKTLRWVSPSEAAYALHTQWLTGDSTDGYKGIPKIGPKKAERFLEPYWLGSNDPELGVPEYYDRVAAEAAIWALYKEKGLTEEYATQMFECARILQMGDFHEEIAIQ